MKILVITGGASSERRISFLSAQAVKKGLEEAGYKVELFDFKKRSALKNMVKNFDVVFPVIHGEEGEGGSLQEFLAKSKKPYIGGNPKGFKIGWYKIPFKKFCQQNKILTSPWKKLHLPRHSERSEESLLDPSGRDFDPQDDNLLKSYCKQIAKFGFPAVLKSSSGGSSREVVILKSAKDLKNSLCQKLLKSGLPLFVEKFLSGIEVTVAILNNKALPVIEIIPPQGGWFDYKNKYSGETQEIIDTPSVSVEMKKLVQQIALQIHQTLDLGPYSRIDFIVSNSYSHLSSGKLVPYVLEVNTIPGLTSQSLFPKAAQAVGISFPNLLDKLIKMTVITS